MIARKEAIFKATPAADHSEKEGYFVEGTLASVSVCNAATDIPLGVIVQGEATTGQDSIAVCGGNVGTCHVKLTGTVAQGAFLQLTATGTVITDAGTGARVVVARAMEAGVTGDLIEAVLLNPVAYAAS